MGAGITLGRGCRAVAVGAVGLLKLVEKRREQKVVVRGKDGTSIEFPAGTPPAEQERLIEMARQLDRPEIEIVP